MTARQGSACSKFIVAGEHSVALGSGAIVVPLPQLRLNVVEQDPSLDSTFNGRPLNESMTKSLSELLRVLEADGSSWAITSSVPVGAGLGSSAALSVALARALYPRFKDDSESTQVELYNLVLRCESLFHKNPSGVDPACVITEKTLHFSKKNPFGDRLSPLSPETCFGLFDTGLPHKTLELQSRVEDVKRRTPLIFADVMDALKTNVHQLLQFWKNKKLQDCAKVMKDSHLRLQTLGVSTPEIEDLVSKLYTRGALAAKITGAGGGGCVLALFDGPAPQDALARSAG